MISSQDVAEIVLRGPVCRHPVSSNGGMLQNLRAVSGNHGVTQRPHPQPWREAHPGLHVLIYELHVKDKRP